MSSTENLMKILEVVNDKGGVNFIYIKAFLETLDEDAKQGSALATRFQRELRNVRKVLEVVTKEV